MCPDEKFGLYLLGNRQEERWRGLDQAWQPQGLHPLQLHTEGDPEGRGLEGQEASLRGCLANSVEAIAARCGYTPCSSREGSQPNSGRTIRQTNLGLCIQALTGILPAPLGGQVKSRKPLPKQKRAENNLLAGDGEIERARDSFGSRMKTNGQWVPENTSFLWNTCLSIRAPHRPVGRERRFCACAGCAPVAMAMGP